MDNTLNQWILSLEEQQLRTFVDTLVHVISASDVDKLIDLTAEWRKSMNGIISAMKELDGQTSEMLKNMIKSLFEMAGSNMKKEVVSKTEATLSLISQKTKPERKNRTKPAPR